MFTSFTLPLLALARLSHASAALPAGVPELVHATLTSWVTEQAAFCEAAAAQLTCELDRARTPAEVALAKRRRAEALACDTCLTVALPALTWALRTLDGPLLQVQVIGAQFFRSLARNR